MQLHTKMSLNCTFYFGFLQHYVRRTPNSTVIGFVLERENEMPERILRNPKSLACSNLESALKQLSSGSFCSRVTGTSSHWSPATNTSLRDLIKICVIYHDQVNLSFLKAKLTRNISWFFQKDKFLTTEKNKTYSSL